MLLGIDSIMRVPERRRRKLLLPFEQTDRNHVFINK